MKPIFPEHIDQQDGDLISAYLRGELSPADKAMLDARRKSDKAFNEEFIALAKLAAATRISDLETTREMLQAHARVNPMQNPFQTKVVTLNRRRLFTRLAAAAAVLLVIAVTVKLCIPQQHDKIFNAHFSNEIIPGKGELSGGQNDDSKAFDYYARKQYAQAAREFDLLMAAHPGDDYILYAAVSHLGAGNFKRAGTLLEQSLERFPSNIGEIVLLQSLLEVRKGDMSTAMQILEAHPQLIREHKELGQLHKELSEHN